MADLLLPKDLLAMLRRRLGKLVDGAAIYTGTIPLIGGVFATKRYFEAELFDQKTNRALRCAYRVRRVDANN